MEQYRKKMLKEVMLDAAEEGLRKRIQYAMGASNDSLLYGPSPQVKRLSNGVQLIVAGPYTFELIAREIRR